MNYLYSECLKVNNRWQPIDIVTVRQSFSDMAAGAGAGIFFEALDTGELWPVLKTLDEWLTLKSADFPDRPTIGISAFGTDAPRQVLIPRVMLTLNYGELKTKEQQLTLQALARWYNYVCQLSGRRLAPHEWSREHIDPRCFGGAADWNNLVLAGKAENNRRSNKPYAEVGMETPVSKGSPPPLLPINMMLNRCGYPEWDMFHIPRVSTADADHSTTAL